MSHRAVYAGISKVLEFLGLKMLKCLGLCKPTRLTMLELQNSESSSLCHWSLPHPAEIVQQETEYEQKKGIGRIQTDAQKRRHYRNTLDVTV